MNGTCSSRWIDELAGGRGGVVVIMETQPKPDNTLCKNLVFLLCSGSF